MGADRAAALQVSDFKFNTIETNEGGLHTNTLSYDTSQLLTFLHRIQHHRHVKAAPGRLSPPGALLLFLTGRCCQFLVFLWLLDLFFHALFAGHMSVPPFIAVIVTPVTRPVLRLPASYAGGECERARRLLSPALRSLLPGRRRLPCMSGMRTPAPGRFLNRSHAPPHRGRTCRPRPPWHLSLRSGLDRKSWLPILLKETKAPGSGFHRAGPCATSGLRVCQTKTGREGFSMWCSQIHFTDFIYVVCPINFCSVIDRSAMVVIP